MPGLMDILSRLGQRQPPMVRPNFRTPGFNPDAGSVYDDYDPANVSWPLNMPKINRGAVEQQNNGAPILVSPRTPPFQPSQDQIQPPGLSRPPALASQASQSDILSGGAPPMPNMPEVDETGVEQPTLVPRPNAALGQRESGRPSLIRRPLAPQPDDAESGEAPQIPMGRVPQAAQGQMPQGQVPQAGGQNPLSDLPPWAVKDMPGDYQNQRTSLARMPRSADPQYKPGKLASALSILGPIAALGMAASGRGALMGAAPALAGGSLDLRNRKYNKALKTWQEEQAMTGGMAGLSTNAANEQDKLATGQAGRDIKREQAKAANTRAANSNRQVPMPRDMAVDEKLMTGEEWDAANEAGETPMTYTGSVANWRTNKTKESISKATREGWERVKMKAIEMTAKSKEDHDAIQVHIHEMDNIARNEIAQLKESGANTRQNSRNATSRANQGERSNNVTRMLDVQRKLEDSKVKAFQSAERIRNARASKANEFLKDAAGVVQTPEHWQAQSDAGDTSANQRIAGYYKALNDIQKDFDTDQQTIQKSYDAVVSQMPKGTGQVGQTTTPQAAGPSTGPARIVVTDKATGQKGTIPADKFDPNKYTKD